MRLADSASTLLMLLILFFELIERGEQGGYR